MARRIPKSSIEPISERRWNAIEAEVFKRLDQGPVFVAPAPRKSWSVWATAAVAALALTGSAFLVIRDLNSDSEVRTATADRLLSDPVSTSTVSTRAEQVTGDSDFGLQHIVTTTGSTTLNVGDSRLLIANNSDILVSGNERDGWRVVLQAGEVGCEVPPRRQRPEFVVQAGDTVVRVVGTAFDVSRSADETRVAVRHGRVRVEHSGHEVVLDEGETWEAPVRSGVTQTRPSKARSSSAKTSAPLGQKAKPSAREEFERAASLESANPREALSIYRRLFKEGGPWAANALYAEARLLLERGQRTQAVSLLERYLKIFPGGVNASDARRLLKGYSPARPE